MKQLFAVLLFISPMGATAANDSDDSLYSFFSVGGGYMATTFSGDISGRSTNRSFGGGFDIENDKVFILGSGYGSMTNEAKGLRVGVGFGWPRFKLGFAWTTTEMYTETPSYWTYTSTAQADTEEPTGFITNTTSIYARLTPWMSHSWRLSMDGYYSGSSRAHLSLPFQSALGRGYFLTEDVEMEDKSLKGYSVSLWHRVEDSFAVRLSYHVDEGGMERARVGIKDDYWGVLGTVDLPKIDFDNRTGRVDLVLAF